MSDVYVVLGMHRTGTSLVSSMLHLGGVEMCRHRCGQGTKSQPWGYFEDRECRALNDLMLYRAGGDWRNPPHEDRVKRDGAVFHNAIAAQIGARAVNRERWGFKDPRTLLTVYHWHLILTYLKHSPYYVFTQRNRTETIDSLLLRHKDSTETEWRKLINLYEWLAERWQEQLKEQGIPFITINFNELVSGEIKHEAERLAEFCGCMDNLSQMIEVVKRRPVVTD